MFQEEPKVAKRRQRIVEELQSNGKVKVSGLSKMLQVTEETIRRDLEYLENSNVLIRTRGGAVKTGAEGFEVPSLEREQHNLSEKKKIAQKALEFVQEGEIIAIDASTTTRQFAKVLPNIPITVITNSIQVSIELAKKDQITVILTGGYLRTESMSLVGVTADKILNDYHVDRFFMSCTGLDIKWGVSDSHELQAKTKERLKQLADQVIVMVDHTKFHQRSLIKWMELKDVSTIITSSLTHADIREEYRSHVNNLYVAD
ncbi:DeoR/GlpR transcriptional regulator [Paenalkalicoccus suaedae]|uniref:DeoR/GlpR transcriptional regulator n=1 Tax=Paenalkalicoccus suaedae TaxID=2592382 RepID=A0A859F9J0_9BACI|nr:DeoR/GlpR family DNA-binding transcription regulator [Paenalkalicoccus suaedae]QKS69759.1 DeoR/GlpR transcriptional regulator [Paenalkalicoccus suaedae]